jgi:hypothetical protein
MEHQAAKRGREPVLPEYSDDGQLDYFDIRVPHDEVISADIRASRNDYNWESWTTAYALGWIAYREIDRFRLLSPSNLGTSVSGAAERRLGVKHIHPDVELLSALREGRLSARPSIEAMHLGGPNPIPPDWWKGRTLADAPHLRFARDDVTNLWTASDRTASSEVALDIHASKDGLTTFFPSAPVFNPWEPSGRLRAGELKVIQEAKRHWPDCKCLLRTKDVYSKIIESWDRDKFGDPYDEVTIKRALRLIPAWNAWRKLNLGEEKRGRRAVGKTVA